MDKLAWVAKFIHTPKDKEKGKTGWGALIGQSSIRGKRETEFLGIELRLLIRHSRKKAC